MKGKRAISILVAVTMLFSILATMNAGAKGGVPGDYIVSRNSDYSTQDTSFYTADTLYAKIWSEYIDTENMKTQILELKDVDRYKETYQLTTIEEDGVIKFVGSCDTLENFATGTESIEVKLKIEDTSKNKYEKKFKIDLIEGSGNELPAAFIDSINPNPADLGVTVSFSGHGEDTDGTIVAYEWSSDIDGTLSTESSFSTSILSGGTHTISFKVQDDDLDWSTPDTDMLTIVEPNYPPDPPTSITPDSTYDTTPLIQWTGASDPNGDPLTYEIQIGTTSGGNETLPWDYTPDNSYPASLDPGLYYVQVKAYDGEFYSDVLEEALEILVDIDPPTITDGPYASAGTDTATITWTTDESADSIVDYGLSSDNLDQTESNPDYVTDHSIVLTGLSIATTYYYQVSSTDASGNGPTYSTVLSFTTDDETIPEGWIISKNADYSTSDDTFALTDTIYMMIWSENVNADDMRKSEYELKDSTGHREKSSLIRGDGITFIGSVPASNLALGAVTGKLKLEDNNRNKYEVRDIPLTIVDVPDTDPPVITDGPYANPGSTTAGITWTTDEDADSVVDYGLSPSVLDMTESSPSYVTSHSIQLIGLSTLTTYYYQVSSTDDDGNGPTYSDIYNFTTTEVTLDDWTYIVYQCGDNDLAAQSDVDLNEMKSLGSTDSVNVLTLQDKNKGDDTKAYYVEYNNLVSIPLSDIDSSWNNEVNMGDPDTLTAWITYCINTYPADYYAVTLWDHGYGWEGICWDDSSGSDPLELAEVESALFGLGLDVVCLDACLMGMASVTYQLIGECDYLVSSEESVPWDGYPYDSILDELTLNPTMTPANLAIMTVNEYEAFYNYADWETLSAVDMSLMDEVADAVDTFALEMIDGMSQWKSKYSEAKNDADYYDEGIDLYDFARLVKQKVSDPDIENAAQGVMDAVTNAVTANYYGPWHWNTNGISIYYGTLSGYSSTKFCQDINWDEYLDAL